MGRCDEVVVTIRRERPSGPPLPRVFSSVSKSREGLSREPPIYPEDGAVGGPPVPKQRLIYGDGKVFFLKESMRIRIMKDEVGGGAAAAPMSPDADPAESMTLFNPGHVLCVKTRYYAFVFPSLIWSRIKRGGGGVGGGGCCARASERAVVGFFFLLSQTLSLSLSLSLTPPNFVCRRPPPRGGHGCGLVLLVRPAGCCYCFFLHIIEQAHPAWPPTMPPGTRDQSSISSRTSSDVRRS